MPPVMLYDGDCVLCSASVRYTLAHERAPVIRFVAIQSREGRALAAAHGVDALNPDTFLFIEDGRAHGKSDGVIALARHLSGPARLVGAARVVPRAVRDWLYDRVARNRYRWFGRRESCLVPDRAMRARFVLPGE